MSRYVAAFSSVVPAAPASRPSVSFDMEPGVPDGPRRRRSGQAGRRKRMRVLIARSTCREAVQAPVRRGALSCRTYLGTDLVVVVTSGGFTAGEVRGSHRAAHAWVP